MVVTGARQRRVLEEQEPLPNFDCQECSTGGCDGGGPMVGPHQICVVSADVADAFYQFSVDSICEWFGLDDLVYGWEIGLTSMFDPAIGANRVLKDDERVFPVFRGMPQGWTWALRFCTMAVEWGVSRGLRDPSLLVREGLPPQRLGRDAMGAVYVDNLSVFGLNEEVARQQFDLAVKMLADVGFTLYEVQRAASESITVGIVTDSKAMALRHKPGRAWRLYQPTREILSRRKLPGEVVRVLVGHYNHYFTLASSRMSIFHLVYRFVQENIGKVTKVPNSVKQELRIAMGVIFLADVRIGLPRSRRMYCVDASSRGYAMLERDIDPSRLEEVCSWRGRWRVVNVDRSSLLSSDDQERADFRGWRADFEVVDTEYARYLAGGAGLGSLGEDQVLERQAPLTTTRASQPDVGERLELVGLVPKLPEWLVRSPDWRVLVARRWGHEEAIHMKDKLVPLMTLRRQSRRSEEHGK